MCAKNVPRTDLSRMYTVAIVARACLAKIWGHASGATSQSPKIGWSTVEHTASSVLQVV